MNQEDLIRAQLGPELKRVTFRLGGADWVAWSAPPPSDRLRSHLKEGPESLAAYHQATVADAKAVADETTLRAANIRYFLGTGDRGPLLWAIPGLPALEVIELAKVGTHNGGRDGWRVVRDLVSSALAGHDFDVVFADTAGLEVRSITLATTDVARRVDRALLDRIEAGDARWIDSYGFMLDRAAALGLTPDGGADPRGGGQVASFIATTKSLRLWWD
jgi:hypothetical protein